MRRGLILLTLACVTCAAEVFAIQKCVTQSGDTVFTDMDCPTGSRPTGTVTYQSRPASGLRPGEREMLERVEAREAEQREARRYARERDARHHVGYGDRLKIRELEMERRSLNKSLTRGDRDYGERRGIRSRIDGIDRQIEQLRAPKW